VIRRQSFYDNSGTPDAARYWGRLILDHRPPSIAYMSDVLNAARLSARKLRTTRLADLVNTLDPKVVAAAFAITPEAAMIYLSDHVDSARLPQAATRSAD
jgi:hypothetical protein